MGLKRLELVVPPEDSGRTLQALLHDRGGVSHAQARGLIDAGAVRGIPEVRPGEYARRVRAGERFEVRLDPARRYRPRPAPRAGPGYHVVHHDRDLLVVDKDPDLLTVPTSLREAEESAPHAGVRIRRLTRSRFCSILVLALDEDAVTKDSLTITDNRTGSSYEVPIQDGTIRAMDLRQIKTDPDDFGLMAYDPAFTNTAACRSRITMIDGDRGILNYRGYPIEKLAEQSTYLETAYLILHGDLPSRRQYEDWVHDITHHTIIHE